MGVFVKPESVNKATGEVINDDRFDGVTRCLATLVVCGETLQAMELGATGGDPKVVGQAVLSMLTSLNVIYDGNAEQLARDTDALAARLGAKVLIVGPAADLRKLN